MKSDLVARILLGFALFAVIGSCTCFLVVAGEPRLRSHWDEPVTAAAPVESEPTFVSAHQAVWESPKPQSRGSAWIYHLFGPPNIVRGAEGNFEVAAAAESTTSVPTETNALPSGVSPLSLLGVRAELFRLQLVGFTGRPGKYRGVFENVETGETFLAGAEHLPQMDVSVERFCVEPTAMVLPEGGMMRRRIAKATVRDGRTGKIFELTNVERRLTSESIARLRLETNVADERDVRVGETIECQGARFRIEAIRFADRAIVITREGNGQERETRTLTVTDLTFGQIQTATN